MSVETIDHATLLKLAAAGVECSARVVAQEGGWGILLQCGKTERTLAAQRSQQIRLFRKFETLVAYLRGVGIQHFHVDAANYDSLGASAGKRPDRALALKDAHAAAAYTKWLQAEVQEAIDDPDPTVPHDEAMRQVRAALKRR